MQSERRVLESPNPTLINSGVFLMNAKRLVLAVLVVFVVALLAGSVFAVERKIAFLSMLNITAEEYQKNADAFIGAGKVKVFTSGESYTITTAFYDSLTSMIMALNAGEVDEISLPEPVAEYVMNVNDGFEIASIVRIMPASLAMGFRKDDDTLRKKFNEALFSMKADGALTILRAKYIDMPGYDDPEPVKFDKFENVDTTIKVAVTGDIPPIDYIAPDGTPAGFNTAVLAEIASRMKVNVQLVNIESGARAAALASKRVDVVFWFRTDTGVEVQADVPEGIVLSEEYYNWKQDLHVKKK